MDLWEFNRYWESDGNWDGYFSRSIDNIEENY